VCIIVESQSPIIGRSLDLQAYTLLLVAHQISLDSSITMSSNPTVLQHIERIWTEQLIDPPPQTPLQIEAAKATIELFLNAFEYHDYDAICRVVSKDYIQHNITVGAGQESIIEFAKREFGDPATNPEIVYKRILVDGEYIVVHFHVVTRDGTDGVRAIEIPRYQMVFSRNIGMLWHQFHQSLSTRTITGYSNPIPSQ